jgi:hypothetical protein
MVKLSAEIIPAREHLHNLKQWQSEIDKLPTFKERSDRAKSLFSSKNKKGNGTFDAVKEKLTEMCSGAERCVYCEDSKADEVEHVFPKDLFPGRCFEWNNYVYACGTCNGPKNNKFAVFRHDTGAFQIVNQKVDGELLEPVQGEPALINPRDEDAMEYCILDIKETFKFAIVAKEGTKEYQKAFYTFNEVLRLNEQREYLRQARKSAYENYKSRLYRYHSEKNNGASISELQTMVHNLKAEAHPTVWKEMQRWHIKNILFKVDQQLNDLFIAVPESLQW